MRNPSGGAWPAARKRVLRRARINRGQPYGSDPWTGRIAKRLGLESSLRDPWRPKKQNKSKGAEKAKRTASGRKMG